MKIYHIDYDRLEVLEVRKETPKRYFCAEPFCPSGSGRQIDKQDRYFDRPNCDVYLDPEQALVELRRRLDNRIAALNQSYAEAVKIVTKTKGGAS